MTKQEFLAFSLPYGLKVKFITDRIKPYYATKYEAEFDTTIEVIKSTPILHPLTDLTKEIEHKGEKFMPIIRLGWYINLRGWSESNTKFAIENISFNDAKQLIEWHFDIAGLIEKGEAIDVNTLETNPYK